MPVRQHEIEMGLLGQRGRRLKAKLHGNTSVQRGLFRLSEEPLGDIDPDHAVTSPRELNRVAADSASHVQDIQRRVQANEILDDIHILGACLSVRKRNQRRKTFLGILVLPRKPNDLPLHRHEVVPSARPMRLRRAWVVDIRPRTAAGGGRCADRQVGPIPWWKETRSPGAVRTAHPCGPARQTAQARPATRPGLPPKSWAVCAETRNGVWPPGH